MPVYALQGIDPRGVRVRLRIDALTPEAAQSAAALGGVATYTIRPVRSDGKKLPTTRFLALLAEIAALTSSGVSLTEALSVALKQTQKAEDRRIISALADDIHAGVSFSAALEKVKTPSAATAAAAIKAGERSGDLGAALQRFVAEAERRQKLKNAMQSALIYPAILSAATVLSIGVILFAVAPGLAPVFATAGDAAPASARYLLAASNFLIEQLPTVALSALAFMACICVWLRTPRSKAVITCCLLNTPVLGALISASETARVLRMVASVASGGASVPDALELAATGTRNTPFAASIKQAARDVREGQPVSEALAKAPMFDVNALGLVGSGEKTGRLPDMMLAAADALERKVELTASRIAKIAPPVMTLVLGGVVGGASIAILSALMAVNDVAF